MAGSRQTTGYMIAALVLALAALLPAVSGRGLKVTLLAVALIFFLVGLRETRNRPTVSPDA